MNDNTINKKMILFMIEMPKDHFDKLVSLFEKVSIDLISDFGVDEECYEIFLAFLEAMENK